MNNANYRLHDWIDINKLNLYKLSRNPNAIELLVNTNDIDWEYLSQNENAIQLLEQNQDKIYWNYL